MAQTTIVYAHPYDKSFNHAILTRVIDNLTKSNVEFNVIDLHQDQFDPTYSPAELKLFSTGKTQDPLVEKYQEILLNTDKIIFIFPIWWNDMPAMMKGFIDKVFKNNFAYEDTTHGVKGLLTNIKSAEVFTTSQSPNWYQRFIAGNAIKRVFIKATLSQIGIKHVTWKNLDQVKSRSQEQREAFLNNL